MFRAERRRQSSALQHGMLISICPLRLAVRAAVRFRVIRSNPVSGQPTGNHWTTIRPRSHPPARARGEPLETSRGPAEADSWGDVTRLAPDPEPRCWDCSGRLCRLDTRGFVAASQVRNGTEKSRSAQY